MYRVIKTFTLSSKTHKSGDRVAFNDILTRDLVKKKLIVKEEVKAEKPKKKTSKSKK